MLRMGDVGVYIGWEFGGEGSEHGWGYVDSVYRCERACEKLGYCSGT